MWTTLANGCPTLLGIRVMVLTMFCRKDRAVVAERIAAIFPVTSDSGTFYVVLSDR
jgi:hypothetical protein